MMQRRILSNALFILIAAVPLLAQPVESNSHLSRRYRVTVTNLTRGQPATPAYIATHSDRIQLFNVGEAASPGIVLIAEEGDTSLAMTENAGNFRVHDQVVAGTMPFMPGQSVSAEVDSIGGNRGAITVVGMLATTNDAFYALNAEMLSNDNDPMTFFVPAYDAGSERNSESCAHIPGPPCTGMGVRAPDGAEGFIHIHSGIFGVADLPANQFDWNNPVVRITIERINNN